MSISLSRTWRLIQAGSHLPWARATFGDNVTLDPPAGLRARSPARRPCLRRWPRPLLNDAKVFLMGEDIGVYGGAFGFKDLIEEFGPDRVRDTPISENTIVGATAVGSAVMGTARWPRCSSWISSPSPWSRQCSRARSATCSAARAACRWWCAFRRGPAQARTGTASLESWFLNVPGLKGRRSTATPYDARACFSRRSPKTTRFSSSRTSFSTSPRPRAGSRPYIVPLGQAAVRHRGLPSPSWARRSWSCRVGPNGRDAGRRGHRAGSHRSAVAQAVRLGHAHRLRQENGTAAGGPRSAADGRLRRRVQP